MIAIIDYGVGNLFSLVSSLRQIGANAVVTADPAVISQADKLILPGVGAFGDAIKKLRQSGLDCVIQDQAQIGKPILGICLGMQLLFERSYEYGNFCGLGLLKGSIIPMEGRIPPELKIPHIGWNALKFHFQSPLFRYVQEGDWVYFVHSYYASDCESSIVASTEYGIPITAAVQQNNIMGCQFHPEKSGEVGLAILRGFCEMEVAQ